MSTDALASGWAKALGGDRKQFNMFIAKMMDGFAYHKIVVDKAGKPVDYVFLEVNHAFEKITGLKRAQIIGKKVTEAVPGIEKDPADWIGVYGKVALTGEPVQFENHAAPLGKWYKVSTYCPEKSYFVAIFEDITERKKAEEDVKSSTLLLKSVFNSMFEGVFVLDKTGKVIDFNDAFCRINRFKNREDTLSSIDSLGTVFKAYRLDGSYVPVEEWPATKALQGQSGTDEEFIVERTDLGVRWISSNSYSPLRNERGEIVGAIQTMHDITERKKADNALRKQSSLVDLSPDAIIVKKIDDTITFWSQGAQSLYGWTKEEAIGQKSRVLLKTKFQESYEEILSQLERNGRWSGEKIHQTKSGHEIIVDSRWLATCDLQGEIEEILETNVDITRRKKTEEALRLSEDHYRSLFSSIGEGFELMELVVDGNYAVYDLRYLEVNDTYEKQTGLKAKDVLGKTVRELFPKIEGMWIEVFEKVIKTGLPTRLEDYHQATNRYYSAYYFPFGNKKVGVLFSDITERKKAEEALKQRTEQLELTQKKLEENAVQLEEYASQMEELAEQRANQLKDSERLATIGATAGMVGHDIRNPLQAITGDLYLAKTDLASIPESEEKQTIQESLTEIEKNIDYINKIVADLQDFARPLKPNAEETDLKLIIDQLLSKNGLPENVKVSVKVESPARKFVADSTYINRIMYNLVNNAVQAMPKGGDLTIHAYKEAQDFVIVVKDTGVGIPEAVKSKLFTPMFTTKSKGQGFGLAVIKRMTESLGGTVTFESQEGKGTTFIVRLPSTKS